MARNAKPIYQRRAPKPLLHPAGAVSQDGLASSKRPRVPRRRSLGAPASFEPRKIQGAGLRGLSHGALANPQQKLLGSLGKELA